MALGFGFNKAKVLNSAEKYVQQGKLQNAINEYEKVIKQEPKDLTVLNTIGDLYARLGQTDRATAYFKRVGDIYGADGFTVKAIAMYKKITKLNPGAQDCIQKLAELYTQQGLYNDARQQYVILAEQNLKTNDLPGAIRVFQKILELDPENAAMQSRIAELYIRTGKHSEAQAIFFRAAESLYQRGAMDAADDALKHVLRLDPTNARATLMRGKIALEAGDGASAAQYFAKVPDLDNHPEALHALLRAHLLQSHKEESESLARKLLEQHNDTSGIHAYAEWLFASRSSEDALRHYFQFADQLLESNPAAILEALGATVARVKENPAALEMLLELFRKAGDQSHVTECCELLAHALVKAGELRRAEELYRQLMELEPENPLHEQHHRQVLARLGEDAAVRTLTPQEAGQAFMVDELEVGAPEILQTYSVEDEQAIKAALTDSELFDSYNAPAKGLVPLEKVLASAPQDVRVNQRLASLYARLNRFAEAAQCCQVLQEVYERAGHIEQAAQYRDMATRYRDRAAAAPPVPAPAPPAADSSQPSPAAPDAGGDVFPAGSLKAEGPPETPAAAPASEIDLSEEWESSAVESPAVAETRGPELQPAETEELLNEVRFYLSQDMWEEAQAVVSRLAIIAPDTAELPHLRQRLAEMRAAAPAEETEVPSPAAVAEPAPSPAPEFVFGGSAPTPETAAPRPPQPVPPARTQPGVLQPAASAAGTDTLGDFVLDLEEALGNDFQLADQTAAARKSSAPVPPVAVTPAPAPSPAAPVPAPVVAARDSSSSLQPVQEEAASPLADMFAEFKEEAEQEVEPEDPETHYNLGVAFKEMGLLDEAIGELQKVCQAVDHGLPFSQVMQAYTWLANCFVEKGVPEAGIKWYERALKLSPDEDSRMAVHYDLASAYEAAGNKQAALQHFLEVYGSNIDYRDVADRIQALRS